MRNRPSDPSRWKYPSERPSQQGHRDHFVTSGTSHVTKRFAILGSARPIGAKTEMTSLRATTRPLMNGGVALVGATYVPRLPVSNRICVTGGDVAVST